MIIRSHSKAEQASVLVIALVTATLLGITLGGYMLMVQAQNVTVVRSQAWNAALAMAEAGAEEALAQLNPGAVAVIDRTANGWGAAVGGYYGPVAREFTNASYEVKISTATQPTIYSTGHVTLPALSATLTRVIKVTATNSPLFTGALVAVDGIRMNGNNITSDSFSSENPNLSANGQYDSTRTSTNGDIASMFGVVDIGNANIKGSVLLGPAALTFNSGPNGSVLGDVTFDFSFEFPDVVLPSTTWLAGAPSNETIDGVNYQYVFRNNGDYAVSSFSTVYVSNAVVRLRVTGSTSPSLVRVGGTGTTAGNLTVFMGGPSFSLSGKSIVDGGIAKNLTYLGLPSNTQITFGGNSEFVGTVYAPSAALTMSGGGNNTMDCIGALVVRAATLNGHFNFHFDEALMGSGLSRGYVAASWQEL
jgi:hypothetical protein